MEKYLEEKIEFFFTPPTTDPKSLPEKKSVLYLLRRDIYTCLGINPTTLRPLKPIEGEEKFQARWPGIMTIMTGIDLLGQYFIGSDCPEGCGTRFKNFLKEYTDIEKEHRNVLYQLRNALIHSFGLFIRDSNGIEYKFILTSIDKPELIERGNDNNEYIIGDIPLHKKFEEAVENYHKELLNSLSLQRNFEAMFIHYSAVFS